MTVPYVDKVKSVKNRRVSQPRWAIWREIWKWSCLPSLLYCISRKTVDTEYTYYLWCMTSNDIVKWRKKKDYENFERGIIYMIILKKGGCSREKGGGRRKRNPCPMRLWLKALWRPVDLLFPQLWRHSPCIFSILYYKYNTVSFYLDIITIYCKTENVLDSAHFNNNVLNNNIRFLKINSIKVLWKMKAAWTVSCMHAICLSIHILWIENNLILTFFSAI